MKCLRGLEQDVKDLLKHYESLETYTDCEEYRKQGAISALEKLLAMWNEQSRIIDNLAKEMTNSIENNLWEVTI